MKHVPLSLVLVFLSVLTATTARAQNATVLERRAGEVCAQFRQMPGDYEKMFAPSFLAQVPAPKLTEIFADYFSKLGRCTQAKQTASLSAYAGRFDFIFEKGSSVSATLAIDADEPRLLNSRLGIQALHTERVGAGGWCARAQMDGRRAVGWEDAIAALGHVAIMARRLARHPAHAGQYDDLDQRQHGGRRVTHDSGPRASGSYFACHRSR
jgi:hypothetical protein